MRHTPSRNGLTRVANPQQDAGGLQTRLNVGKYVGDSWEDTSLQVADSRIEACISCRTSENPYPELTHDIRPFGIKKQFTTIALGF